ncbi:MAG: hypothetical protein K0U93_27590 [Gammaproteobacteria bacterium]|nr:hypothetical protein [Gammaproteobacteria bacterium]
MPRSKSLLITLASSLVVGLIAGRCATADDTEVYSASLSPAQAALLKPNVLFIVDTSGSMGASATGSPYPYDPNETYAGTCVDTQVYWSNNGTPPTCATNQFFFKSQLRCEAATPALSPGGTGIFQDRLARFDGSTLSWMPLGTTPAAQSAPHVECEADRGSHGENASDTATYITSASTAPWQVNQAGETSWRGTGSSYTLYNANYLNYANNPPIGTPTRLEVVKATLNQIIAANSRNINLGIMRFDTKLYCSQYLTDAAGTYCAATTSANKGGPVVVPVTDVSALSDQQSVQNTVSSLTAFNGTPLSETLYEAMLYFRGEAPHFGTNPPTSNDIQSAPASLGNDGKYLSPITHQCQNNYVVYLTDGTPDRDIDADALIAARLANSASALSDSVCDGAAGDNCLDELAELLASEDQAVGLPGDQAVQVYTIGFLTNQQLLQDTANKGKGSYYTANDALQLSQAFSAILSNIRSINATFSAPSVSVNAFNRIANRKELFFSLFAPTKQQRWPGNIKRFELGCEVPDLQRPGYCEDGSDADSEPDGPVILDANGSAAVDPVSGLFKPNSRSYWTPPSAGPDGDDTRAGGAAGVLGGAAGADDPATRLVYTYTGLYTNTSGVYTPSLTGSLSASSNLVAVSNSAITSGMFYPTGAAPGDPGRDDLVNWARGADVLDADSDGSTTDARHQMGDALHTSPVVFEYGADAANSDLTLFTINNDGYLHAFDVDTAREVFSFIPREILPNVPGLFSDHGSDGGRPYTLDGPLTLWFDDRPTLDRQGMVVQQPNGVLEPANGERVVLYFGQRRGGNRYYAVDVTQRSNPTLLWKIEGGQGDFAELGQTWSAPTKARVALAGQVRDVLFFGGGYDATQDHATLPQSDTVGRAIFAVDALTGQKLWTAGPLAMSPAATTVISHMSNSVPSDLTVFDITGDGLADRIYFGDTGAQLFRIDINNENTGLAGSKPFAIGGRLATLQLVDSSTTPGGADNRRFFYRPDVALVAPPDGRTYLNIAIGSGYRAHPLEVNIEDRFYAIRDLNVGNVTSPTAYPSPSYTEADLLDITSNISPTSDELIGTSANKKYGWYIRLGTPTSTGVTPTGEKVLAPSVTFKNRVMFTTFTPPTSPLTASCLPDQGTGRLYSLSLTDGAPVQDLNDSGTNTYSRSDRSVTLLRRGIPPGVAIVFSPVNGVTPTVMVGTEALPMKFKITPVKTYWWSG